MESIDITTSVINLDQLLKFAGIVETGGQVKLFVEEGLIWLNGTVVTERRKKIRPGDIVEIKGIGIWKVMLE
jgi:ribosome-associated protein